MLQISGAGTLGSGSYGGAIGLMSGAELRYSSNKMQTFSGNVTGPGNLTKDGTSATLTLSGANTYSGITRVDAGSIYLIGSWNLGSGTARIAAIGAKSVKYESSGKSALPKLSSSPTSRLPIRAPLRLPMPPTITTTNA